MPNFSVIIFLLFVVFIFFILKAQNSRNVINELNNIQNSGLRLIRNINDVKCVTFLSGAKNKNYSFNKADLYLYENALLVVGYFKIGNYKFYKSALLFSQNERIINNQKNIKVISPQSFNLHSFNDDVYIEFDESNFINLNVEIRLKNLNEDDKNLIQI